MKIVKINKIYRNNNKEHFLVLLNEPYSYDDINCLVEEWCENDPSGSNYGYKYEWSFIEDQKLINNILDDKIKIINNQIKILNNQKNEIERMYKAPDNV